MSMNSASGSTRRSIDRVLRRADRRRAAVAERVHDVATSLVGVKWDTGTLGVALTFDDGPHPQYTTTLLDLLERHDVRATFFLTGSSALRHRDIVRRADRAGHAIGSHSMNHPFIAHCNFRTVLREYRDGRRAVERVLGRRVRLFRPPGSDLGYRSLLAMRLLGLRGYLSSADPEDWIPGRTAEATLACLRGMNPGDIALLHDNIELPVDDRATDRSQTLVAVEEFLTSRSSDCILVTLA
jgi:chitooligosaccharide deacetylase